MKFDKPTYERFLYWIKERYSIWLKREAGQPKPWSDDKVFQTTFFTMPYRELDKTTLWFRQNVRYPLWDNSAVLMATIIFRWFNYIPTGLLLTGVSAAEKWNASPLNTRPRRPDDGWPDTQNLLKDWRPTEAKRRLTNCKDKVFTGAFNISNSGSTKPKIDRVIDDYINPVWADRKYLTIALETLDPLTLRNAHSIIKSYPGLGGSGFMAYEIVCDLRFTYLLEEARDVDLWCNMGPGAKRGLNRLLGLSVENSLYKNWLVKMRELHEAANSDLQTSSMVVGRVYDNFGALCSPVFNPTSNRVLPPKKKDIFKLPHLEMREIEHSLCEFDKYERVRLGQGQSKRSYPGIR